MTGVVHFEIHATDPDALGAFYGEVFGWTVRPIPQLDYWILEVGEGGGIAGGMVRRRGPRSAEDQGVNAFVCSIAVPSAEEAHARALAAGAVTALPLQAIPGVGYQVYIKDPDGNLVGLHQADTSAH
jgi:predicted enzyme related to lactoylglutathione lyase